MYERVKFVNGEFEKYIKRTEDCLSSLRDSQFTKPGVKQCIGVQYGKIDNNTNYIKSNIYSIYDLKLKRLFEKVCLRKFQEKIKEN